MSGVRLVRLARVGSTQDELRDRLALAQPGGVLAVAAAEQVDGRGREGRRWQQAPGAAIALSVGARGPMPAAVLDELPGRVAAATRRCLAMLEPLLEHRVAWKAPNDLVEAGPGGAKLAGILVDARTVGDDVDEVLVGVGANLAGAPFVTQDGRAATTVAHLAGHEVDGERLLALLVDAIAAELSARP